MKPSQNLHLPLLPSLLRLLRIQLQCLLRLNPLLHRNDLVEPRSHTRLLQHGTIRNGQQLSIVMRARKIQQPRATILSLVLRGRDNAVHGGLEPAACEVRDGVSEVDGDGSGLCGDPGPVAVFAEDLEPRDGLAEEQREGPEIGVSACGAVFCFGPFGLRAWVVDHVSAVVLALAVVRVLLDEVVFVRELEDDGEETQQGEDDVCVESFLKGFDFREVGLEEIGLAVFAAEVVCEFGEVVDFDVVACLSDEGAARTSPAVVVGVCVVDLVLFLLRGWEFEEVLGECELSVDCLLRDAEVLHVELALSQCASC